MSPAERERLRQALENCPTVRIPETECSMRAAVTLILRAAKGSGKAPEALFVRRAEVEGDPWSGNVALPGGRRDPTDADLLDTARRETLEETGIRLERADYLGRLGEIVPRSRHLPAICVTPFVAWLDGDQEIRFNHELTDHVWIPVPTLRDPEFRSTLRIEEPAVREFVTIDYEGHVIWGLTFKILEDFLAIDWTPEDYD